MNYTKIDKSEYAKRVAKPPYLVRKFLMLIRWLLIPMILRCIE